MRLWPLIERDWLLARPFPSGAAAPIAPQAGTEHLSRRAHSACAERRSESIDSPVASSTPVCTRWMGWTRLVRSSSRMPLCSRRIRPIEPPEADTTVFVHFRCTAASAHKGVASWPTAATECRALLRCTEVHAMRRWPLIERDWLRVRSRCRCCDTGACFDCGAMSGATARVQQPDAMPPGVAVDVGGVCAHYRETEGRALAISTCYTGSAGSLSSLSQHGRHQPE